MDATFEYKTINIGDVGLDIVNHDKLHRSNDAQIIHGGKVIRAIVIDGEPIIPSWRFWESLYSRFKLNRAFFKFFNYLEVFKRIADKSDGTVRVCIEKKGNDKRLLAVTGLNKPVVIYDDLLDILQAFNLEGGIRYSKGIVSSRHAPMRNAGEFKIGGDKFSNRFEIHTPIDGYGQPNIYLSLLRWVCSNGAVGFANSFKTALSLGQGSDSIHFTLRRALESFTNEEGYALLRGRFETAQKSWASIREQQDLYRMILKLQNDNVLRKNAGTMNQLSADEIEKGGIGNALMKALDKVTGNPYDIYGISNPDLMSPKKQRSLPVECKVYDMINFATELATHHVSEDNSRQLQAWVGQMISGEFDLEDSCDQFDDWKSTFLQDLSQKGNQ